MQESQSMLDLGHLISNETSQEFVRGRLKNRSIKHGSHQVLDFSVEIIDGGVERGGASIDPSKDPIVNGRLDGVNFVIDIVGVERRLVVHALID